MKALEVLFWISLFTFIDAYLSPPYNEEDVVDENAQPLPELISWPTSYDPSAN